MPEGDRIGVLFMQSQEFFGADSQIHASIMRHLDRDRFEVHCAAPKDHDGTSSPSTLELIRVPDLHLRPTYFGMSIWGSSRWDVVRRGIRHGIAVASSLMGLAWYVRRNRIRIIHCTEKPRDAIFGTIIAPLGGARCVVHVHVQLQDWIRSAVRRSMRRSAALIGVSEFVAQSIRDVGYEPTRVSAVLNGLELDDWDATDVDTDAVRREFGIASDAPLIITASRLYRWKGQHLLLAALPEVKRHVPDVRLLIVGSDDPRSDPGEQSYSASLHLQCDQLGLSDNVIFAGWRTDVRALMAASDVYAMPSFEEPFGMVFTEAMYLRRPVVALDNGGTREVVVNGESGLLSEPDDVEGLARNLVRLLADPALRRRMGESGRRRVQDHLNSERMARDVERVYERVVASPR